MTSKSYILWHHWNDLINMIIIVILYFKNKKNTVWHQQPKMQIEINQFVWRTIWIQHYLVPLEPSHWNSSNWNHLIKTVPMVLCYKNIKNTVWHWHLKMQIMTERILWKNSNYFFKILSNILEIWIQHSLAPLKKYRSLVFDQSFFTLPPPPWQ